MIRCRYCLRLFYDAKHVRMHELIWHTARQCTDCRVPICAVSQGECSKEAAAND